MPTKSKRSEPKSPLVAAQAAVLAHFQRQIKDSLGSTLGRAGLARVQRDVAVISNLGDQVVVHAPLKPSGTLTYEKIAKTSPLVGVLATSASLRDPVSGKEMKPGAYAVRLRAIGRGDVAFDFLADKSTVAFSARAWPSKSGPVPDPSTPIPIMADVDIVLPSGKGNDPLWPPGEGDAMGIFCLSFCGWVHCWQWHWPVFWTP